MGLLSKYPKIKITGEKVSDSYREQIEYVANANQALVLTESLDELLPKKLEIAEEATGAEASSYLQCNNVRSQLVFVLARNKGVEQDLGRMLEGKYILKSGEGIAGAVLKNRAPLMVHNVADAEDFSSKVDEATGYTTRSILCVPVIHMDTILGVIQVLNPKSKARFDECDQQVLEIFASLAAVAIVRHRYMEERLKQKELEAQVAVASKIQSQCWPVMPELPHGSRIWGQSRPAREVGGDLFDCIPARDGSYYFYVADVAGKGLPAGFIMAALWSSFRSEAHYCDDVTELVEAVNRATFRFLSSENFFATVSIGRYWPENGQVEMVSAGHGMPLWHDGADFREFPKVYGLPLGVLQEAKYKSESVTLTRGAMIMLYSDGLNEAFNLNDQMFGLERPKDLVVPSNAEKWGERLFEGVFLWGRGREQTDDITLLGLWRENDEI